MAKTEREKMLANELYRAADPELVALRRLAQEQLYRFNHAHRQWQGSGDSSHLEVGLLQPPPVAAPVGNEEAPIEAVPQPPQRAPENRCCGLKR